MCVNCLCSSLLSGDQIPVAVRVKAECEHLGMRCVGLERDRTTQAIRRASQWPLYPSVNSHAASGPRVPGKSRRRPRPLCPVRNRVCRIVLSTVHGSEGLLRARYDRVGRRDTPAHLPPSSGLSMSSLSFRALHVHSPWCTPSDGPAPAEPPGVVRSAARAKTHPPYSAIREHGE